MILVVLLGIISQSAIALSLGDINVRSHFAEPFLAEIELPSHNADEMGSIEVHLASQKQHLAMGYELTETTKQFRFTVKENTKGDLYIEVRSKSAVKELSISFLLEVTSINGRIIKKYEILLSPKDMSKIPEEEATKLALQKNAAAINIANKESKQKNEVETKAEIPLATESTERPSKIKKLNGGGLEYTRVDTGESLSRIAQLMRPHKSMHMYQIMIALYNENPDAFLNRSINNLKVGSSLKLINIDGIKDISPSEARKLVRQYANRKEEGQLQFTNANEIASSDALLESQQKELAEAKEKLEAARMQAQNIKQENKMLLERIVMLESKIDQMTKSLFLPTTQNTTESLTNDKTSESNLLMNAGITSSKEQDQSAFSQLQLYSLAGAALLLLAFVASRKKDKIQQIIDKLHASREKKRNNIFR